MDRRRFLPCLAAAALAGCKKRPRQFPRVRVSLLPRYRLAPVYLADELGFFRQAGLEVEIQRIPETNQMIPLVAGGQIDAAFANLTPGFFNAVAKGARMKIVANREVVTSNCEDEGTLYGNRKVFPHGLQDLRLLKGKRVAVSASTSATAFFLDVYLNSVGLSTDDVSLLTIRPTAAAAALIGGKIDALVWGSFDKDLTFASAKVIRGVSAANFVPNLQYTFVIFGRSLLDGDPEVAVGFLWAYLRGVAEFKSGKIPRVFDELALAGRMDPNVARAACRDRLSSDGLIDRSSVQRFLDWSVKKGFVPAPVDVSSLIETRFIEEALRRSGRRKGAGS